MKLQLFLSQSLELGIENLSELKLLWPQGNCLEKKFTGELQSCSLILSNTLFQEDQSIICWFKVDASQLTGRIGWRASFRLNFLSEMMLVIVKPSSFFLIQKFHQFLWLYRVRLSDDHTYLMPLKWRDWWKRSLLFASCYAYCRLWDFSNQWL